MKIVFVKDYPPFEVGDTSNVSYPVSNPLIKEGIAEEFNADKHADIVKVKETVLEVVEEVTEETQETTEVTEVNDPIIEEVMEEKPKKSPKK